MIIQSIDPVTRRVYLHADTVGADLHPIDIYKEMRTLRRTDESLRSFDLFMGAAGNVSKGAGSATERYVVLLDGTRIVPYDVSQSLKVVGTIITDDGNSGRDCFDRGPLSVGTEIDIDYQPPQVEVITVSTGSGLQPSEQAELSATATAVTNQNAMLNTQNQMLLALYQLNGLDPDNPLFVSETQRIVGNITQSITTALDGSVTVQT